MSNVDRVLVVVSGGLLLLSCGACSQPWKFARADVAITGTRADGISAYAARDAAAESGRSQEGGTPFHRTAEVPGGWEPAQGSAASFDSFSAAPAEVAAGGFRPGLTFQPSEGPVFDPVAPAANYASCAPPSFRDRVRSDFIELGWDIRSDYRHYYSWATMRDLWLAVGGGAVLANTSLDEDFQSWYQRDVRSSDTDDFAVFWKTFGEGEIFIPAYVGLALIGGIFEDQPLIGPLGEFSYRVTRGYLVGAPPMLVMQYLLGASRPGEASVGSQWKPFDDSNSVSGHAFVGAVPFITAAKMSHNPWMKATFYTLSTFTAWSRVNDDDHYLSQACLGWWMAYLACRAADDTEHEDRCFTFTPLVTPEVTGVGMVVQR
jgi:hypothetical protein